MRTVWLAAGVLAGCYRGAATEPPPPPAPAAAHREPDQTDARAAARRFVGAVVDHDKATLRAMLDTTVDIRDLSFESVPCRSRFELQSIVARDELGMFAGCLGELDADIKPTTQANVSRKDKRWAVELPTECATYQLELVPRTSGGLVIAALAVELTCDEMGVVGGVVGGVTGSASSMPPPPPPPPPSSARPQVVAPTMLERLRVSGSAAITPDDITKAQIATGTKDKFVGSFKLCIDTNGLVTHVTMLKSTGLSDYDAKLQREMRLWQYRPFEVNGQAVPVCTAVTFIYSQKPAVPPTP